VCVPAWAGHRRRAAVRRRAKNRLDLGSGDQQAGIAREFRSPGTTAAATARTEAAESAARREDDGERGNRPEPGATAARRIERGSVIG